MEIIKTSQFEIRGLKESKAAMPFKINTKGTGGKLTESRER